MQPESKWLVLPRPIQPPAINPELESLGALSRSTECLRFLVLSIEYWLSPNGRLRQWMKLNLFLAAFLLFPAIVLMPVIGMVLHEVDGWLSMLLSIVWKLTLLSILVSVAAQLLKRRHNPFPSSSQGSSRRRK